MLPRNMNENVAFIKLTFAKIFYWNLGFHDENSISTDLVCPSVVTENSKTSNGYLFLSIGQSDTRFADRKTKF